MGYFEQLAPEKHHADVCKYHAVFLVFMQICEYHAVFLVFMQICEYHAVFLVFIQIREYHAVFLVFMQICEYHAVFLVFSLEVAVEPWMDGLWAALKRQLYGSNPPSSNTSDHSIEVVKINTPASCQDNKVTCSGSESNSDMSKPSLVMNYNSSEGVTRRTDQASENTNQSTSKGDSSDVKVGIEKKVTNRGDSIGVDKEKMQSEMSPVFLANKIDNLGLTDQSNILDSFTASQNGLPDQNIAVQSDGQTQSSHPSESETSVPNSSKSNIPKETSTLENSSSIQNVERCIDDESKSLAVPNIRQSVPPLSDHNLSVPVLSPAYLRIVYHPGLQSVSF